MMQNLDIAFVYVIATVVGGKPVAPVKIGLSSAVAKRFEALRTASPNELTVMIAFGPFDRATARAIEGKAHRALSPWRLNGEWFDLIPKEALWLLAAIIIAGHLPSVSEVGEVVWAKLATSVGVLAAESYASILMEEA